MEWNSQRSVVQRPPFRSTDLPLGHLYLCSDSNRSSESGLGAFVPYRENARQYGPVTLEISENSGDVQLSWSTATDEGNLAGYRIYRDNLLVGETEAITQELVVANPPVGVAVLWRVEAFDEAGNESFGGPQLSTTLDDLEGPKWPEFAGQTLRGDDPFL